MPLAYEWNKQTGAAVAGREGEGDRDPGDKPKSRWQPLKEPGKSQTVDLRANLDFAETKRARTARDVSSLHVCGLCGRMCGLSKTMHTPLPGSWIPQVLHVPVRTNYPSPPKVRAWRAFLKGRWGAVFYQALAASGEEAQFTRYFTWFR